MHEYMDHDTGQYLNARKSNPIYGAQPSRDDIGGMSDARGDSFAKWARDGIWVTSGDNSGLNLTDGHKFMRGQDGSPLLIPWAKLAAIGKGAPLGYVPNPGIGP